MLNSILYSEREVEEIEDIDQKIGIESSWPENISEKQTEETTAQSF